MPSLRTLEVSFSYAGAAPLFSDVGLHLAEGWTGLVGANGAGKSTLLAIFAGAIEPDEGRVVVEPAGATIALCPQIVDAAGDDIARLAARDDGLARRLRAELALDPAMLARWVTLSPGERKRWQIGAALANEPDMLLLDEPTNHIDARARRLLAGAIARYPGVGVIVTHDRDVLDALTRSTLRLHAGGARLWPGSYSRAKEEWEREARSDRDRRERLRDAERAAEVRLADARRDRASASHGTSSRARMKDKNDHDARGALAKGQALAAEKKLGRSVEVARRGLERARERTAEIRVERGVGGSIFVDYAPCPSSWIFTLDAPVIEAGGAAMLRHARVALARDGRARIEGENGAGKTTLLRTAIEATRIPPDKILALSQELDEREARAALDEIRALGPRERGRVLSLAATLGLDPDRALASHQPSPGEARKLRLAMGLGRHAWAVFLDEPTNHLDLPAIERLEAALAEYPGALLLITHDDRFARRLTSATWTVAGGRVVAG